MKIVFDFDDVLFNTELFKKKIFTTFTEFGVDESVLHDMYQKHKNMFSITELSKEVFSYLNKDFDEETIKRIQDTVLLNSNTYLDIRFVEIIKNVGGDNCFIVSLGDVLFQYQKIQNSGILDIIPKDHIFIVEKSKKDILIHIHKEFPDDEIIFIDDKISNIEEIESLKITNITPLLYRKEDFGAVLEVIKGKRE